MSNSRSLRRGVLALAGVTAAGLAVRLRMSGPRPGFPYLAGAPLLIAHRGGSGLVPENTLLAFERAVHWWGADLLELDVQPTRDGEAVVFHDPSLDRTTDAAGAVIAHSLDQLRQVDAGYRYSPDAGKSHPFRDRGIGISTLADVLDALPTVRVNVEIKDARAQERVWETIAERRAEHRVLIAAGERRNRRRFGSYAGPVSASAQELRAFYLHHLLHATRLYPARVDALQMPERHDGRQVLSPRLVHEAHALNMAVHVWTVDEIPDMHRLLDWGVDGLVTDRPDRLARVLHERTGRPLPPGPDVSEAEPFLEQLLRS